MVAPSSPTSASTLTLSYTIDDTDIAPGGQTNQSEIRWFKSINGVDYSEQSALRNQISVASTYLTKGDVWYVEVSPGDGLEVGTTARGSNVIIR